MDVVTGMLAPCVEAMQAADWDRCVVAYEPVWAIGTGKVATPEVAEATHKEIRAWLAEKVSPQVAGNMRIIYGGSVTPENGPQIIAIDDVDGLFVGRAAWTPEGFARIIEVVAGAAQEKREGQPA